MSRVGKHPVMVPAGVKLEMGGGTLRAQGAKGAVTIPLSPDALIDFTGDKITVAAKSASAHHRAIWGTMRMLIANAITGASTGFTRKLEITGVGYRAQVQGNQLILQLGYSHDVKFSIPEGIKIACPDQTHIVIEGADKQQVGSVAAEIRSWRPVEPYKGKGIKYEGEFVVRKEGKKK